MPARARQLLRGAIERSPEDASIDDAMERLFFLSSVARGLETAYRGDTIPHGDIRRESPDEAWQASSRTARAREDLRATAHSWRGTRRTMHVR